MSKNENISAIVLAGGYSSRMGDFKPLLQLGPYRAVEHAVLCFQRAGIGDVRVVVGFRAEDVVEVVKPLGASVVFNPDFPRGMFSSIQAGVRTLEPGVQAFFMLPVDIPLITRITVEKIMDCGRPYYNGIIYPVFNGRRGHPPLITTRYKDEIIGGSDQDGLRGILAKHEHETFDIEVDNETVLLNMNTPEDYYNLLSYLRMG
ncbi:MAG: nucleotidyltransferase family protein [Eubacteriales bacterium]